MSTDFPEDRDEEPGSNACTVGFISRKDGRQSHDVVARALHAKALTFHRVGYAKDGKTTDGDGIETQVPQSFFRKKFDNLHGSKLGDRHIAVAQTWLPRDPDMREKAQAIIDREMAKAGYADCKWVEEGVIDPEFMGPQGKEKLPGFAQLLIPLDPADAYDPQQSEKDLAFLRERIKTELRNANLVGKDPDTCHFSSFSGQRIIYAARCDPKDEGRFFPDLKDKSFISTYAKIHGRFTTAGDTRIANIQPTAQGVAHNGTIVTDRGATAAMRIHERRIANQLGEHGEVFLPLMWPGASDSVNLGRVQEALGFTGLSMPARKMMLLAKAEGDGIDDSPDVQKTKHFLDAAMEKYDGPALVIFSDGRNILAALDANGLRPAMIEETSEYFALGSEFGMWGFDPKTLILTDELDRGSMLMMDTATGERFDDHELQEQVARDYPFKDWAAHVKDFDFPEPREPFKKRYDSADLRKRLRLAGYSKEDLTKMIMPMVAEAAEPNSSMGNLTRAAAFSDRHSAWSHYNSQLHVQIVAPPHNAELDPDVMNLHGYSRYPLDENGNPRDIVRFPNKFIFSRTTLGQFTDLEGKEKFAKIDFTYDVNGGEDASHKARKRIGDEAVAAARAGKHIVLSDENVGPSRTAIFASHAVGEVNERLIDEGLRGDVSITVKAAYMPTSHEVKILKETGANFVVPYLVIEYIIDLAERGGIKDKNGKTLNISPEKAVENFLTALEKGTYIAMQRTGTMRASSAQGAHQFEVFGLNRELTEQVHPGVVSPISGLDEREIQRRDVEHHRMTFRPSIQERLAVISPVDNQVELNPGGRFARNDPDGEIHAQDATSVALVHAALAIEDEDEGYKIYQQYSDYVHAKGQHFRIFTRDNQKFKYAENPLSLNQVEDDARLNKHLATGAISVGAIHELAHEHVHAAINLLAKDPDTGEGAQSNSGEGGYAQHLLGTIYQPKIIQWSTASFGIRPELVASADVIEFKFGQGAKAGMGGKLDGSKVKGAVAKNRFVVPGTTLNSPPQFPDMQSIEDLKQKIKIALSCNPKAEIRIKIVAKDGCQQDALGAAKAMNNAIEELKDSIPGITGRMSILLSGNAGGTGNAPQTSIQYSGAAWEPYLPPVSKILHRNGFRDSVKLLVDGSMRSGKDMVYAAAHGADVTGFGTAMLYAIGCINQGQCHTGKCGAAVATTDEKLIAKHYKGQEKDVARLARYMIRELREEMAKLGIATYDELVGADILEDMSAPHFDLSYMRDANRRGERPRYVHKEPQPYIVQHPSIDQQIIVANPDVLKGGSGRFKFTNVHNSNVAIGANIAGPLSLYLLEKTKDFDERILPDDNLVIDIEGTPGFATGSLLPQGVTVNIEGIVGDSAGVNNRSGIVTIVPPKDSPLSKSKKRIIVAANLANGYSTGGEFHANGNVGHAFSFRQSGGLAVAQGARSRAGQFKTGGTLAVWRDGVGRNSFAKHSGGDSFVREVGKTPEQIIRNFNRDTTKENYCVPLTDPAAKERLRSALQKDFDKIRNPELGALLERFDEVASEFVHVMPIPNAYNTPQTPEPTAAVT